MRQSFRFSAEDEEITVSKIHGVVRTFCLGGQKKIASVSGLRLLQRVE
jgi:hypothetical protein